MPYLNQVSVLVAQAALLLRSLVAVPPAGVVVRVSVLGGLVGSLALNLLTAKAAEAISFSFIKIADTNTPIPGGMGNFTDFSDPSISDSNVVFAATGAGNQSGMYTNIKGALNVVADTNTPTPGGRGILLNYLTLVV